MRAVGQHHDLETCKQRLKAGEAKVAQEGSMFRGSQLAVLEKAKEEQEAYGELDSEPLGYLGAQDTDYGAAAKEWSASTI